MPALRMARRRRARRERAIAGALAFGAGTLLLALTVWDAMPLPDADGLAGLFALGAAAGALTGRLRAVTVTLALSPASWLASGNPLAAGVALLTAAPAAVTGFVLGAVLVQARAAAYHRALARPRAPRAERGRALLRPARAQPTG